MLAAANRSRILTLRRLPSVIAAVILLLTLLAPSVHAHRIRVATFLVTVGDTDVTLHAPLVPLDILSDTIAAIEEHEREGEAGAGLRDEIQRYFDERLELTSGSQRLHLHQLDARTVELDTDALERLTRDGILVADSNGAVFLEIHGSYRRPDSPGQLVLNAFHLYENPEDAYSPLPVADIRGPGYHEIHPFDGFEPWREPIGGRGLLERLTAFLGAGVWHILMGYDHVLFLLGLHLVSPSLKETLKIVTAFTVSHTVTLTLAATGVLMVPQALVEPAVALTIVYVGVENLWRPEAKRRWITAFCFGLIHGFGFAGAIGTALTGLDPWPFAWALLSFNLGVEVGQAAVVTALAPIWVGIRWMPLRNLIVRAGSLIIALAGLAWFLSRVTL